MHRLQRSQQWGQAYLAVHKHVEQLDADCAVVLRPQPDGGDAVGRRRHERQLRTAHAGMSKPDGFASLECIWRAKRAKLCGTTAFFRVSGGNFPVQTQTPCSVRPRDARVEYLLTSPAPCVLAALHRGRLATLAAASASQEL